MSTVNDCKNKKPLDSHTNLVYYTASTEVQNSKNNRTTETQRNKATKEIKTQSSKERGIALEFQNNQPIYLQVINDIKRKLIRGEIRPGEKLSSVRDLALAYQINPNTSSRVYKEMETMDICFTKRGLGTFITEDEGKIMEIRQEMAGSYLKEFLQGMTDMGFSFEEIVTMLETYREDK